MKWTMVVMILMPLVMGGAKGSYPKMDDIVNDSSPWVDCRGGIPGVNVVECYIDINPDEWLVLTEVEHGVSAQVLRKEGNVE